MTEKETKIVEAIESHRPKTDGLLERLDKKDKQLREFHDLQSPFRQGFMLAEDIVKQWVKENYPIVTAKQSTKEALKELADLGTNAASCKCVCKHLDRDKCELNCPE